jgi:aryl-alcohol dehydrogenase-like predicted oxidoreductase
MAIEYRALGKTGLRVSTLGFGGSEIGYQAVAQKAADKILNTALDAGINVIDTAECYAGSEALIGKAIAGRRAEVVLMTKCGHAPLGSASERAAGYAPGLGTRDARAEHRAQSQELAHRPRRCDPVPQPAAGDSERRSRARGHPQGLRARTGALRRMQRRLR